MDQQRLFNILKAVLRVWDIVLLPFIPLAAIILKIARLSGIQFIPATKYVLLKIGVFPIVDHYYEPQFNATEAKRPFSQERDLPGIEWNVPEQVQILESMTYAHELSNVPVNKPRGHKKSDPTYYFKNWFFEVGDADYWYQFIRLKKPGRIIEIGCGFSTLVAIMAIERNQQEDPAHQCKHVCIEPYESAWLENKNVEVVRKKVEDVGMPLFQELTDGDILFIDSSHVVRPDGDVVFEFLELLPKLNKGVIVHVHDIFSPRNYLREWIVDDVRLWTEQYLLEAFLTQNPSWKIIGALNKLSHSHFDQFKVVAPSLKPDTNPRSFYMQKIA